MIPYVLCFGKNIQGLKLQYQARIMPELSFSLQIASQVSPVHTTGKNAENLAINTKQHTLLSGKNPLAKSVSLMCGRLRWKPG